MIMNNRKLTPDPMDDPHYRYNRMCDVLAARSEFEIVTDYYDKLTELLYEAESDIDEAIGSELIREMLDTITGILEREVEVKRSKLRTLEKLYYGR